MAQIVAGLITVAAFLLEGYELPAGSGVAVLTSSGGTGTSSSDLLQRRSALL